MLSLDYNWKCRAQDQNKITSAVFHKKERAAKLSIEFAEKNKQYLHCESSWALEQLRVCAVSVLVLAGQSPELPGLSPELEVGLGPTWMRLWYYVSILFGLFHWEP